MVRFKLGILYAVNKIAVISLSIFGLTSIFIQRYATLIFLLCITVMTDFASHTM
jgi:hypothetical protein